MSSLHSHEYREMILLLKKQRQRLNWSQKKLADLSGFRQPDISRIENCEQNLNIVDYYRLADVLGVDDETILKTINRHVRLLPAISSHPFKQ